MENCNLIGEETVETQMIEETIPTASGFEGAAVGTTILGNSFEGCGKVQLMLTQL